MKFAAELFVSLMFQCPPGALRQRRHDRCIIRIQRRPAFRAAQNHIHLFQIHRRRDPVRLAFRIKRSALAAESHRRHAASGVAAFSARVRLATIAPSPGMIFSFHNPQRWPMASGYLFNSSTAPTSAQSASSVAS